MIYLVLFTTLAVAMVAVSGNNLTAARNLSDVAVAQANAESGLRWMEYRFVHMTRPKTSLGTITAEVAADLWPAIANAVVSDLHSLLLNIERPVTSGTTSVTSSAIATDAGSFTVTVARHPLWAGDPLDSRHLRVTSAGVYGSATRSASVDFLIDKRSKFAVVGKVPIQLGRNTLVEGPVAMATANKYPPVLMLGDFEHLDATLKSQITAWNAFLKGSSTVNGKTVRNHTGYDNRVAMTNATEAKLAADAGYADTNGDHSIDEYDLFLAHYDADHDGAIDRGEFTGSNGKLVDAELFDAIDSLGGPLFDGDITRLGYKDGKIDNSDGYMKVRGQIAMATTANDWSNNLGSGKEIRDMVQGPIATADPSQPAVRFGATTEDIFDLDPANFEECANLYRGKSGSGGGAASKTSTVLTNAAITAADANGGSAVERTPYGSTSWQATYQRPVFRNMTFRNCTIPKGLNALFDNCKFEGVTFVDVERNIITSGTTVRYDSGSGSTFAKKMKTGSFSNTTTLTTNNSYGFTKGNNLRFNDCTFNGPVSGGYATAYTHFANSWEFTGATLFDNRIDQTATIVAPQTNIEMGSFTNPGSAPSTLIGVVVAGNIDIRGTSVVDGSIIVTGDGAGNTTLAYFGASDSDTDAGALPEGGYGRLNIRYNPNRTLPDGINVAIDITPERNTYREGEQ